MLNGYEAEHRHESRPCGVINGGNWAENHLRLLGLAQTSSSLSELRFPTTSQPFRDNIKHNRYYVDKSEMIEMIVDRMQFSLITRPRRFGKSTNLSMLNEFLNKNLNSSEYFKGLKVSKNENFCKLHQNNYVVIYLNFGGVEMPHFMEMEQKIALKLKHVLYDLWKTISWRFEAKFILQYYEKYLFSGNELNSDSPISLIINGFEVVIEEIKKQYQPFVILVDDYDAPFIHAYLEDRSPNKFKGDFNENEFYKRTRNIMSEIFYRFFRNDNVSPCLGVVMGTGIIGKESVFENIHNFTTFSIFDDHLYGPFFGFTESELQNLIQRSGSSIKFEDFKAYHGGYHFGYSAVSNPNSVVNTLKTNELGKNDPPTEKIIQALLIRSGYYGSIQLKLLLIGKTFQKYLDPNFLQPSLDQTDEKTFWTMLANAGYIDVQPDLKIENLFEITVPNIEMKNYLGSAIKYPNFQLIANSLKNQNQTELQNELSTVYNNLGPYFNYNGGTYTNGKFLIKLMSCVFPEFTIRRFNFVFHSFLCTFCFSPKKQDEETFIFSITTQPNATEALMKNMMKDKLSIFWRSFKSSNVIQVGINIDQTYKITTLVTKLSNIFP